MPLLSLRTGRLLVLTLTVLVNAFGCISHTKKLALIQNEIRAAGEPLTFQDINTYAALPEGSSNAAHFYQQAFDTWVRDQALEKRMRTTGMHRFDEIPPLGEPPSGDMLSAARKYIELNQRAIGLLLKASRQPYFRMPVDYTLGKPTDVIVLEWMRNFRHATTKLLVEQLYVDMAEQNGEKASDTIVAIFRIAGHAQQHPEVFCALMGNVFNAQAYQHLTELRAALPLSHAALGNIMSAIQADSEPEIFTKALLYERVLTNEILSGNTHTISDYIRLPEVPDTNKTRHHAKALTAATRFIEDTRGMRTPIYAVKEKRAHDEPNDYDWEQYAPLHRSYLSMQRGRALRRATLTALAADRYRLDHDAFPASLDQLVPDYLPAIPEDPFNPGQQLRIVESPFGVIIYSVGPDLTDNHGRRYNDQGTDYMDGTDITAYAFTTPGIPQPLPKQANDLN